MTETLSRMSNLSEKQLAILNGELNRSKKSVGVSYLLWFLFGYLGVHKFYMGKAVWGISYFLMLVVGWSIGGAGVVLAEEGGGGMAVFGFLLLIALGILLLVDLFTIPGQIRKNQEKLKEKLILDLEKQNQTA